MNLKSYLQLHHALQGRPGLDFSGADTVQSAESEYVENKKARLLSLIKQFGTPEDRKRFEGKIPYLSPSIEGPARQLVMEKRPFMAKMGSGFSTIYSSIANVLREQFGISPDDLAFTRELKSYALETGRIRQSFSTSPFLKTHLPALYEEKYQASISKAQNPEEFAETIRTAVQLPIRKARLSKIARNSIPRLLKLPGDVLSAMNSLIADEAIPRTLQVALVDASLRHTGFSADQANFLINHPSIDWETRKKVWNAVLARGDVQVNRSLKVPLSISNPFLSKCTGFYMKISK